jgi:hypothetical protein
VTLIPTAKKPQQNSQLGDKKSQLAPAENCAKCMLNNHDQEAQPKMCRWHMIFFCCTNSYDAPDELSWFFYSEESGGVGQRGFFFANSQLRAQGTFSAGSTGSFYFIAVWFGYGSPVYKFSKTQSAISYFVMMPVT